MCLNFPLMMFCYVISLTVYNYQNFNYVWFHLTSLGIINMGVPIVVVYFLWFGDMQLEKKCVRNNEPVKGKFI